ncbi:porin [Rhodoferax sp.]|uniref:porin n=1 Tax=Rhodoferax sp. TaxID=50421 RepID=UPI002715E12D|nr:porin [Rhodoferax sp.]MDO9142680.1 porin [Rhodoferax sp.]
MNNQSSSKASVLGLRHVALASALCCAGLAQAQTDSSVTLYGLADVGITSVSGLKAGTVTQVASGIMEGSRWGIKGTEDMGGGYKAIFNLEARVELDTGANKSTPISGTQLSERFMSASQLGLPASFSPLLPPTQAILTGATGNGGLVASLANEVFGVNVGQYGNRFFDRQAYVGMITPVGAVLAGRMYTPAFETNSMFDIMETQSGLAAGQIVAFPAVLEIRKSNALQYRIVKDGFSGSLMYALGDNGEAANDKSKMLGFNASYKASNFAVGLGYNAAKNELGQDSLKTTVLGASMTMNAHKVSGMVIQITDDNPSNMTTIGTLLVAGGLPGTVASAIQNAYTQALKQDGTLYHLGYRYTAGVNTISVAYTTYDDKRPSNADVSSYGAAYTYALSKRTDLNLVAVRYNNKNTAQVAPGGNGYIGGVTASPGTDSNSFAFGIRHRF